MAIWGLYFFSDFVVDKPLGRRMVVVFFLHLSSVAFLLYNAYKMKSSHNPILDAM